MFNRKKCSIIFNLILQTQIEMMVKRFPSPPMIMMRPMLMMAQVLCSLSDWGWQPSLSSCSLSVVQEVAETHSNTS